MLTCGWVKNLPSQLNGPSCAVSAFSMPLTRRSSGYTGALPDKITIFRGPLERLYGSDPELLRERIRHVVWHEVAHHFGISDARLVELGRY